MRNRFRCSSEIGFASITFIVLISIKLLPFHFYLDNNVCGNMCTYKSFFALLGHGLIFALSNSKNCILLSPRVYHVQRKSKRRKFRKSLLKIELEF